MTPPQAEREWLETNAAGSFALGCVDRKLRRKYHSLFTLREPGQGDPWNVVAEVMERLQVGESNILLVDPFTGEHALPLADFRPGPNPTHTYRSGSLCIERRLRLGPDQLELRYRIQGVTAALTLELSPLLRARGLHDLTFQNPFLDGSLTPQPDGSHRMLPYAGMPALSLRVFGMPYLFDAAGTWHAGVFYAWEAERGYEAHEDLFSPGSLHIAIEHDCELTLVIARDLCELPAPCADEVTEPNFAAKLERSCAAYVMRSRANVSTVVAGFPWFGPWGRDALLALPGIYLASGNLALAQEILAGLADARICGLIPNIPAIAGTAPNTSSIDASLLFIRALHFLSQHAEESAAAPFMPVAADILEALIEGTDARMGFDGALGVYMPPAAHALTWMDAMVDGRPVTPRTGYAVDIDALAYSAARFVSPWADAHRPALSRELSRRLRTAEADFLARYWDDTRGYLADAHDGERADIALRPNQLWAIGCPYELLPHAVRRAALKAVRRALFVPAGLRTLSPDDPRYRGHYGGDQRERDLAYHQGTVWPWLLGIYADAVVATTGAASLERELSPAMSFMVQHLDHDGCIGHIGEIFDGDAPHAAGGCPAQAWSVAEVYRALRLLQSPGRR